MQEFTPLVGIVALVRRLGLLDFFADSVGLCIGGSVNELKDERSTCDDTGASR